MSLSLTDELRIFLYSSLGGAFIILFYDIVSVVCKKDNCSLIVLTICDGISVTVACAITVFITLTVSRGMVRFYEFVGLILGGILYKLTFSRLFCLLFTFFLETIYTFFKFFFKILLTPLLFMFKMINRCIRWLFCPVVRFFRQFASYLSQIISKAIWTARKTIKKT